MIPEHPIAEQADKTRLSWRQGNYLMGKRDYPTLTALLSSVLECRACEAHLPLDPKPIFQVGADARILLVSQAPGLRAHTSGIPWADNSGERLRKWMGINSSDFYDPSVLAHVPMGYCYPGRRKGGDLPPSRKCADLWLEQILSKLPRIKMTLLIGSYAQTYFLGKSLKSSLTSTVRAWNEYMPRYFPLPHPSTRNIPWVQRNLWFDEEVLPALRERLQIILTEKH